MKLAKYLLTFMAGVALSIGAIKIYNSLYDGIDVQCQVQLQSISENLKAFKNNCKRFPTEKEGLGLLNNPSSINCNIESYDVPLDDPWDKKIIYIVRDENVYLLTSNNKCSYHF